MTTERFSDIPIRSNGEDIDAGWFNTIRLLLVQIFGDIAGESSQSIGDADIDQHVTAVSDISCEEFSRVDIECSIRRVDSLSNVFQTINLTLLYKGATLGWVIHGTDGPITGDDALISFDIFEQTVLTFKEVTLTYSTTALGGTGHAATIVTRHKKWAI